MQAVDRETDDGVPDAGHDDAARRDLLISQTEQTAQRHDRQQTASQVVYPDHRLVGLGDRRQRLRQRKDLADLFQRQGVGLACQLERQQRRLVFRLGLLKDGRGGRDRSPLAGGARERAA